MKTFGGNKLIGQTYVRVANGIGGITHDYIYTQFIKPFFFLSWTTPSEFAQFVVLSCKIVTRSNLVSLW